MRTTTRKGGLPTSVPSRPNLSAFTITATARRILTVARGEAYTEGEAIEAVVRASLSTLAPRLRALPPITEARTVMVVRLSEKAQNDVTKAANAKRVSRSNVVEHLIREYVTPKGLRDAINGRSYRNRVEPKPQRRSAQSS